jgi:hypothetical protein
MPVFCYTNEQLGQTIEELHPMGKAPEIAHRGGHIFVRDWQAEHRPRVRRENLQPEWDYESDAAGVHPDQVPEAVAYCKEQGVPTHFNPQTGNPVMENRKHRRDFHKIWGVKDRDAGYGDYGGA